MMSQGNSDFPPSLNFTPGKYRVRFLEEIREVTKGNAVYNPVNVELITSPATLEKRTAWIAHSVLRKKLDALKPLTGRIFDIENKGKPKGKRYFDYEVAEVK